MKRIGLCMMSLVCCSLTAPAQKFTTEKSHVAFFSKATVEDIKAENVKAVSIFNVPTGEVAFSIPIKDFEFDKGLMKEHFNEKYLETEKYPKATFQGKFIGFNPEIGGEQTVQAQGRLTMHGITQEIDVSGTLEFAQKKILAKAKFNIKLADYKIEIPQLLWQNLAEVVEVSIDFTYKPL